MPLEVWDRVGYALWAFSMLIGVLSAPLFAWNVFWWGLIAILVTKIVRKIEERSIK